MSTPDTPHPTSAVPAPTPPAAQPARPPLHKTPTRAPTPPAPPVGEGQEHTVRPTVQHDKVAAEHAQAERARQAGLVAPPSESQKHADEPRPNWAVPTESMVDPLAGLSPAVLDALEARIVARMQTGGYPAGGMGGAVPIGMKLVPIGPTPIERSLADQEAFKRRSELTTTELSQQEADRLYPALPSDKWYRCRLADGNQHPVIHIPAASPIDAAARYKVLCGIRNADRDVTVVQQHRDMAAERDYRADEAERLRREKREKTTE